MSTSELQRQHQWMGKADRDNSIDPNSSQAATANWSDGNRRGGPPQGRAHQLLVQYQIFSPEIMHTETFLWTNQVIFNNICVHTHEDVQQ